jgi:hypothetical protein
MTEGGPIGRKIKKCYEELNPNNKAGNVRLM